ncbi:MAG: SIS domain-containing protein [Gammaproteobacteria bacterium]|nr:SIS domain-containing protein [Gammaproteobacteria bacterium]
MTIAPTAARLTSAIAHFESYATRLAALMDEFDWSLLAPLAEELAGCVTSRRQVFICGNGGSAGNAGHLGNDFIYGVAKSPGRALRVHALTANPAVLTCLANDEGYERVFELQLRELADGGDVLIAFSGSGNSPNIVKALEAAREIGMRSYAVLGYSGGRCKALADHAIHFPIDDMQIAEDMQLVVGHMLMQWLYENRAALSGARSAA